MDFWDKIARDLSLKYSQVDNSFSVERYRMQLALEILKEYSLTDSLLDIGCGSGEFLALCDFVDNRLGIDFSEKMITIAGEKYPHIPFKKTSIEDFTSEVKYSAIIAFSVLPYIRDDIPVYSKIYGMLKDNGLFICTYPNILFNMFTDNELTYDFMNKVFYNYLYNDILRKTELEKVDVKEKAVYPEGSARGKIFFREENPLEIGTKLFSLGFNVIRIIYLNIHPLKPKNMKKFNINVSHGLYKDVQIKLKEDWRSTFLASTFMVVAAKISKTQ